MEEGAEHGSVPGDGGEEKEPQGEEKVEREKERRRRSQERQDLWVQMLGSYLGVRTDSSEQQQPHED